MIIQNEESIVKTNGAIETANFEIKTDDGKMFHILSNLYSNPLGAVVRELSTNCGDGHKIAGTPEKPFDILLPGRMDMGNFISFRDYGPGMPHEIVMSIFTTFGSSTKSNSNVETGCLGLGSKSPLAISDSFTVTSINNGHKTIYSVSKDAQKKPVLTMFGSSETDELNGLIVTVPLTDQYVNSVENEIKKQLEFFKIKPNIYIGEKLISNWSWHEIVKNYFSLTDAIFIRKESGNKKSQIIQGEIGYSFNSDTLFDMFNVDDNVDFLETKGLTLSESTQDVLKKFFKDYEFLIFMPMGTVTFAPSREELIYDEQTAQNIMEQVISSLKLLKSHYESIYKNIENNYQYRILRTSYYKMDKVSTLDEKAIKFLNFIGFGFENKLLDSNSLTLLNGDKPDIHSRKLHHLSYYNDILEMKNYFPTYISYEEQNMIKRRKTPYTNPAEYERYSEDITDYVSAYDYKNIKIVFVNKETKFYRKHTLNYMLSMNETVKKIAEDKDETYEAINVILVKLEVVTQSKIDEFISRCGLSAINNIPFTDVLVESQKYIDAGKAPVKEVISKPKTLRTTHLNNINRSPEHWKIFETNTYDIKNNLEGIFINTFNNKIKLDGRIKKEYPIFYKMLIDHSISSGLSNIVRFLNATGAKMDYSIDVYSGHEKNFKKTNLINVEDYIISIIEDIKFRNAWHALNLETKTYRGGIIEGYITKNIIKNLDYLHGKFDPTISDNYKEAYKKISSEHKTIEDWFYLENHPILEAYETYHTHSNGSYYDAISNCGLDLDNKKDMAEIEKYLDVKIELVDVSSVFEMLDSKYNLGFISDIVRYKYSYTRVEEIIEKITNSIYTINKKDFFFKKGQFLKGFTKKPVVIDDEYEMDGAVNKHDYIEAPAELVAE